MIRLTEVIFVLTTFGFLEPYELVILLVIALIIFGPGKLPELGKSLGKGIREFKAATNAEPDKKEESKDAKKEESKDD